MTRPPSAPPAAQPDCTCPPDIIGHKSACPIVTTKPAEQDTADGVEAAVKWMNKAMCWLAMQASDAAAFRAEGDEIIARLRAAAPDAPPTDDLGSS